MTIIPLSIIKLDKNVIYLISIGNEKTNTYIAPYISEIYKKAEALGLKVLILPNVTFKSDG